MKRDYCSSQLWLFQGVAERYVFCDVCLGSTPWWKYMTEQKRRRDGNPVIPFKDAPNDLKIH